MSDIGVLTPGEIGVRATRRFRLWREMRNVNQGEGADMLGVSPSRLSNLESGVSAAGLDIIARIHNVTKIPLEDLVAPDPPTPHGDPRRVLFGIQEAMAQMGIGVSKLYDQMSKAT